MARICEHEGGCAATPMDNAKFCYFHHPDFSEERTASATKGGQVSGQRRRLLAGQGDDVPAPEDVSELLDLVLRESGRLLQTEPPGNARARSLASLSRAALQLSSEVNTRAELNELVKRLEVKNR